MNIRLSKPLLTAAVSAIALAATSTAFAADLDKGFSQPASSNSSAPKSNFYISLFGGANIVTGDVEYENDFGTVVDTDFSTGFTFGGALGYKWTEFSSYGITPRTEIEVNYSENNVDTIDFSGNGPGLEVVNSGSQASGVGILGNLFFDLPKIGGSKITPYFGGGVGVNIINHNLNYNAPGLNLNDDGDVTFTWHVTGGAAYAITERTSFFTDVGFHQSVNAESERRIGGLSIDGANGGNFEDDINSIVVRAGLSVGF